MMYKLSWAFAACLLLFTVGCSKDDPEPPNQEELITTLVYSLSSTAGETVELRFEDLDGDGGMSPVITGGTLSANTVYQGAITLLNESESPAENITLEVAEEDLEHQFFFTSTIAGLDISYTDQDGDGNPVGLASSIATGAAGSGTITVILRHEPNKSASGVADGNIANAGGETDIEVTFDVTVL